MPGVLILEALAQLGAAVVLGEEKTKGNWLSLPVLTVPDSEGRLSRETDWT